MAARWLRRPAPSCVKLWLVGRRIHAHFGRLGGLDLDLPVRSDQPDTPYFGEGGR